jgi:uncharacterized membrane protein
MADVVASMQAAQTGHPGAANADLMRKARETLRGRWHYCAGVTLVFMLVSGAPSIFKQLGSLITIVITGPLSLGITAFYLALVHGQTPKLAAIFDGFRNFLNAFLTYLLMMVFVILWLLLLIVPGIIAALSYALSFYILAENPAMVPMEVLRRSKQMMNGYKLKLFYLGLRFIGWGILCIFTLGIGFLWLIPYAMTSVTLFYEDVKSRQPA